MEPTMSFSAPVANAPAEVTQAPVSPEVQTTSFAPEVPVVAPQQITVGRQCQSSSVASRPSQVAFGYLSFTTITP